MTIAIKAQGKLHVLISSSFNFTASAAVHIYLGWRYVTIYDGGIQDCCYIHFAMLDLKLLSLFVHIPTSIWIHKLLQSEASKANEIISSMTTQESGLTVYQDSVDPGYNQSQNEHWPRQGRLVLKSKGVRSYGNKQRWGLFDSQHYSCLSAAPVSCAQTSLLLLKLLLILKDLTSLSHSWSAALHAESIIQLRLLHLTETRGFLVFIILLDIGQGNISFSRKIQGL